LVLLGRFNSCSVFGKVFCQNEVGLVIAFIACWEMALAMLLAIPIFGIAQGPTD